MHPPETDHSPQTVARIFAVIVLYRMTPAESPTVRTFLVAAEEASRSGLQLGVLVRDNTPGGQDFGELPGGVRYEASPENRSLAGAYNRALEIAGAEGYDWLLTLDQDTELPPDFLTRISRIAQEVENTPAIAAIVPRIRGDGRALSPYWFPATGFPVWFDKDFVGVSPQATFAFNSASTIRVSALRQIGGYHPWFWLDCCDFYMYRQLHRHGKRVYVLGDLEVNHELTMLDLQGRVSPARYRDTLLAESAYWDMEMTPQAGIERTARLLFRAYKHFRRGDSSGLRAVTYEFIRRRLFWSRRRRLQAWEAETKRLMPGLPGDQFKHFREEAWLERPWKLSVCMAAYNGEPFVKEQFESILCQLKESDEVIVVDDLSTDSTRETIRAFHDDRIRLIEHTKNRGVVATFEDAVRNATGDIIFLADDDDIWAPHKVEKMLEAFRKHPKAQIVTSRVFLIDENGLPSKDPIYNNRKTFYSTFWRNILMNHYQGSAMAFRSSLLHSVLPFPRHVDFVHDHWIGTRNALLGGEVVYIDEPLLLYRRHSQNDSRRRTRLGQVKIRLQSIWTNFFRHLVSARN